MHTMHPTLLIGPADWDERRLPREEFDARTAALWRDHSQAGGAIVFGDARDHGALAYLTNFTPKLEPSIALIAREGPPQLLVGGGVNMIPAAKPLTFVDQLLPLRNAGATAEQWARGLAEGSRILLIGGDAMPYAMRRNLANALGSAAPLDDGTASLRAQMRRKSARELALIREACMALDAAVVALAAAQSAGQGVTDAVLAAEHAAWRCGAQDVRSLFSLDGGRTLRPFEVPIAQRVDPLQVYLAVCHTGYWAEAFVLLAGAAHPAAEAARTVLRQAIAQVRPGATYTELADHLAAALRPGIVHPAVRAVTVSLGLTIDDETSGSAALAPGSPAPACRRRCRQAPRATRSIARSGIWRPSAAAGRCMSF